MRMVPALLIAALTATASAAMQVSLDPRAISEAVAIGQSRIERDRTRFHEPYRLVAGTPPVDFVEVVTPFRRIVLAAQARAQVGDRSFGQRQAIELLNAGPDDLELWVEFTFHPLNTYVGVPRYQVSLSQRAGRIAPRTLELHPRYGPRVEGAPLPLPVPGGLTVPERTEPLQGGTVIARFDLRALEANGAYDVLIEEAGKELARVRVDLARLR